MQADYLLSIYFAPKHDGGRIITDTYYNLLYVPMTNTKRMKALISNKHHHALTWWIGRLLTSQIRAFRRSRNDVIEPPLSPFNALSFESRFASAQTNVEEPSEKAVYDDDYFQFGGRLG